MKMSVTKLSIKRLLVLALSIVLVSGLGAFTMAGATDHPIKIDGSPSGLLALSNGTLLLTDTYTHKLWQIVDGKVEHVSGRDGIPGINGVPYGGYNDGKPIESALNEPWDIAAFLDGYAISDSENNVIRFINKELVYTAVGSGEEGFKNGFSLETSFSNPTGLATGNDGSLYIADTDNHVIRKLDVKGNVTTFAGSKEGRADGAAGSAQFRSPTGLYFKNGSLYVADTGNHRICVIKDGMVSTIAGKKYESDSDAFYEGGYVDGALTDAEFASPQGVLAAADGSIYVADTGNGAVRKIKDGQITTIFGGEELYGTIYPAEPRGLAMSHGYLYVSDPFAGVVFNLQQSTMAFSDVPVGVWYYPAVEFVTQNGFFNGMSETTFAPATTMDRAMFVTVLSRIETKMKPNSTIAGSRTFSDVDQSKYYFAPVAWGADNGIVSGTSADTFEPGTPVSREMAVMFMYRYAQFAGKTTKSVNTSALDGFKDGQTTADWAKDAMAWAVNEGLVLGNTDGELKPKSNATRAETAQLMQRFYAMISK